MLTLLQPRRQRVLAGLLAILVPTVLAGGAAAAPARQSDPTPPRTTPVPDPHEPGVKWFAATGHTLRGSFLVYWERYGGLAQFGYPITEEFIESPDALHRETLTVQYFERNRFEHHPENAGTEYEVLLGALGKYFHPPDPAVPAQANPATEYFGPTGHNVTGAFRAYWHAHGGLFVYGYPISEAIQEVNPINGKTYRVQYFERSRFEWHPDQAGTPYEVLLGLLGTQLARQKGYFEIEHIPNPASYPSRGHAADFSWVAGEVQMTRIQSGCTFVRYSETEHVQPVGASWDAAETAGQVRSGSYVVLFGHLARPGELVPQCPAQAYIVDRVQANTAP